MEIDQRHSVENRDTPSSSSYQRAADELELGRDEIKRIWESRVREQVSSSSDKSSPAITNTLGTFLDELVSILRKAQSPTDESLHLGMSTGHGGERAHFTGYFLPQLLKEFSILRQVVVDVLLEKRALTHEVRSSIDSVIDTVISSAATEFAAVQHADTKAALLKSETSNLDLERFASVAAHDLKSPLATISGYLSLLDNEFTDRLGEEGSQFVQLMVGASQRMRNLIDSLLDYARLTKNNKPFQTVDLNNTVKAALQNLDRAISNSNAEVTYSHLPAIMGDADLLTQLFQNLIVNSIKFRSTISPKISIHAEAKNGMWEITLRDNGIGFDPKCKNEIFELYKKLHGEGEYQGSGIGLATCRKVVELHGGTIHADSKPGAGSIFQVTFPKRASNDGIVH